ncbi:MAG: hypothetical protein ACMUHX_08675 [bacterium]
MPQAIRNIVNKITRLEHARLSIKKDWLFLFLVLGGFILITSFLAMHHEPWRDEAQDWLMARDLGICSIFKMLSYSGHPMLWYAILEFLDVLKLPYGSIFVVNLIIAWAGIFIFLVWSPFSKTIKVLLTFSTPFLIEYSTIARGYALCLFLLFSVTALYDKREKYPIIYALFISLIFNIHYLCLTAALFLTILFIIDVRKRIEWKTFYISIAIMISGFVFSMLSLIPTADEGEASRFLRFEFGDIYEPATNAFSLDILWRAFPGLDVGYIRIIVGVISVLLLIILMLSFLDNKKATFFLYSSYSVMFGIFIFKLRGELRHHFFLIIFWIIAFWMYKNGKEILLNMKDKCEKIRSLGMLVIVCSLLLSVSGAIALSIKEYKHQFSSAKDMAFFIRGNNLNKTHIIVSYPGWSGSALLPFLPETKFWYPEKKGFGTFIIWDKERERLEKELKNEDVLLRTINKQFSDKRNLLILLNRPLEDPERHNLKIMKEYSSENMIKLCERFYLYYYKPGEKDFHL